MRPTVKYGPCPFCGFNTWSVHGPNGDHWMCSKSQIQAMDYAAERSAATKQPGSGDQLRQLVSQEVSNA